MSDSADVIEQMVEALKGVPMFESNGYTKRCLGCGAVHFFCKGPPVVIKHKKGCWAAGCMAALAAASDQMEMVDD